MFKPVAQITAKLLIWVEIKVKIAADIPLVTTSDKQNICLAKWLKAACRLTAKLLHECERILSVQC